MVFHGSDERERKQGKSIMSQITTSSREREEEPGSPGEGGPVLVLCESREVRVSEIVGDLELKHTAATEGVSSPNLLPMRTFMGMRLGWYDLGVVGLVVASLAAALLCLINHG